MTGHKIGPWSVDDWRSFIALDVELQPPESERNALASLLRGRGGLLGGLGQLRLNDAETKARSERIEAAWAVRRAHPVYRTLTQDPNFRQAWKIFERRHKAAETGELAADTAPFVFLREYVESAGFAYQRCGRASDAKYGAHAKRRRSAARHALALTQLLDAGIRLSDYSDTVALRGLLRKLTEQMQSTKRKEYGGQRDAERWVLKGLAQSLIIGCDLRSPAVLTHFARMVGVSCEPKTAQRYCSEAAERWRAALAERRKRNALAQPKGQKASPA